VQHHYSKQHQNSTPTPQVDEPNNDYEIVTDPNFDISLNGASDDESEVSDEDIEWGDYLNSLVGDDGCESESNTTSNALLFNYEELSGHNPDLLPIHKFPFQENPKSRTYFWQDYVHLKHTGQKLGGIKGITWRAVHQTQSYENKDVLDTDDAKIMLYMMDHALNNGGRHQKMFFDIVSGIMSRVHKSSMNDLIACLDDEQKSALGSVVSSLSDEQKAKWDELQSSDMTIKIPSNEKDANELLLSPSGKFSVFSHIPNAAVKIIGNHAVVALDELFDQIVAQGVPILWLQDQHGTLNQEKINGCPAATKLYQEFLSDVPDPNLTALGLFLLWSDGFRRVYVKVKKNSVWMVTMSVLNPSGNATSIFHTYCVALGNSSLDHTPVLDYLLTELEKVKHEKIRYCGISGDFIKTSFRMLAYSTDRIERCDLLNTTQFGTYCSRSHFTSVLNLNTLPFCGRCEDTLIESLQHSDIPAFPVGDETCEHCCRWDYLSSSPASLTNPIPDQYPTRASSTSPEAPNNRTINETHVVAMRQQFAWLKMGIEFAHHNLVTNERTPDRKRVRWTKKEMETYLMTMGINQKIRDAVYKSARDKILHPNAATIPFVPNLWQADMLMERFLNSPMHLLFHGIVATVMVLLLKFMTLINCSAAFERFANEYLSEIESLRLDWLKLRELPKKQWLAENLLAIARVMPSIYGLFFLNFEVPAIYSEAAMSLQQTLHSLHVMISSLMNTRCSYADSKKVDIYVKIFLSSFVRSARLVFGNEADEWIMNKGNPVSLLNMAEQLEQFGPARWYYEGIWERYIQVVKPYLVKNMRRTVRYFVAKLKLIHRMIFIKWIIQLFKRGDCEEEQSTDCYKGYYRYKTLEAVQQRIQHGRPLSCFQLDVGPPELIWIAIGRTAVIDIIPLQISDDQSDACCGMHYFPLTLQIDKRMHHDRKAIESNICRHCIVFPYVSKANNQFNGKFTTYFSDWDVLKQDRNKGDVSLSFELFRGTS
jgi:hypothetical protein